MLTIISVAADLLMSDNQSTDRACPLCRPWQESRQVKNPYHRDSALQYLCMTTHALHQVKALP